VVLVFTFIYLYINAITGTIVIAFFVVKKYMKGE
jgi:hypothetical protein